MTPAGNFHFDLATLHNAKGEAIEVAPGTGTRCTCPCRLKWICASAC
jgi:hypothetical protein